MNIESTLAAQIPKSGSSFKRHLLETNAESIFPIPTDEQEIRKNTLDIRNGHYEITSKVIKSIINMLASSLTYITNLSFTEGIFPSERKIVLSLYKSNDQYSLNNYRPIALLS